MAATRFEIPFHGRRKGKTLRSHHAGLVDRFLPEVAVDLGGLTNGPGQQFHSASLKQYWMEIGFGGGENLAADAKNNPDVGIIGCEPFINGVAKLLAHIHAERLANVRIHAGDAREVLEGLPDASIDCVKILYPDPWPKWKHRRRRFISPENIRRLARIMKTGAELRFATDIDDYSAWALRVLGRSKHFCWTNRVPGEWLIPWPDWPGTRYEAKAIREGRHPVYLTFVRTDEQ